ncbi:hypothetical protein ACYTFC_10810 [Streptomyces globosus]|uniref:hypothetical protein n=1 Tax=Streptomyces sp. WAC05292 TaxID=2487418 RepID=UPI000F744070|nr:hypothetical protein [Streptomyces sp. WAC05292]RSS85818.1 hypothetical protein EF903_20450 [Streptomyces sp. WAC05292]
MSARRPLLTALGATTLLAALCFVPSAGAAAPGGSAPAPAPSTAPPAAEAGAPGTVTTASTASGASGTAAGRPAAQAGLTLADTGGVDTTPYLLAGTACLIVGAGSVTFSVRRSRGA